MPTGAYDRASSKRGKLSDEERKKRNSARTRKLYATSEKYRRQVWNNKLNKAFSINADQYEEWNAAFGGVCHICESKCPSKRRLAVDHNHKSGLVRGLLCINCNKGLGNFKDNPKLMLHAIEYLKTSQEIEEEVVDAINAR